MKISALNQPLGMGTGAGSARDTLSVGVSQPKMWIVSAIGAGVGLASSLFGGAAASRATKEQERRQRAREAAETGNWLRKRNEDYVDTNAGQNLVRRALDFNTKNWRMAQGAQAVGGGTDAATALAKEAGNRMMGETLADIAANDTARKDAADDAHQKAQDRFAQMDMAREAQRAQNITNAAQSASNAIMSAAGAVEQANTRGVDLAGGSNNSKVIEQPAPSATQSMAGNAITSGISDGRIPTIDEQEHLMNALM